MEQILASRRMQHKSRGDLTPACHLSTCCTPGRPDVAPELPSRLPSCVRSLTSSSSRSTSACIVTGHAMHSIRTCISPSRYAPFHFHINTRCLPDSSPSPKPAMLVSMRLRLAQPLRITESSCAARLSARRMATVAMAEPNRAAQNGAAASKVRSPCPLPPPLCACMPMLSLQLEAIGCRVVSG